MQAECQAIERAIQLERDGHEFYLKAAERTSNTTGREMFLALAEDELIHLRVLERQLNAIQEKGRCELLPEVQEPEAGWDAPLFPKDKEQFEKAVHPQSSDLEALHFALQAENESFELYRKMAEQSQDSHAREMYRWLASVERGHFNQLMLNYESLLSSGHWAS